MFNKRFIVFGICLFAVSSIFAATYIVPTDQAMVRRAHAIVIGEALSSFSQRTDNGRIETVTTFAVHEVIKGAVIQHTIDIHEPGGQVGDLTYVVPGAPQFNPGEEVLLFLYRGNGRWAVNDLGLGRFSFATNRNGIRLLVRDESELIGWDTDGKVHVEAHRSAERFLDFLRAEAAGRTGRSDYLVAKDRDIQSESLRVPIALAFDPKTYTMLFTGEGETAPGKRWANFPNAQIWYKANNLSGAANGGDDMIIAAIGKWTNDSCSNVNYTYGGLNASANGGLGDGFNGVRWEVNLGFAPFSCGSGGVIAQGSFAAGGLPNSFNNENWDTIVEGNVDGNQGLANCSFTLTGDFLTAMVHEFGHTLAFRHSNQNRAGTAGCAAGQECTSSAIMNSSVVGGLNGVLQGWDTNAVRGIYPSACGSVRKPADFTGDGRSDISIFRPVAGDWFFRDSASGATSLMPAWGQSANDIPVPGDYDGDSKTDAAVFRRGTGEWFIRQSSNSATFYLPNYGPGANDIPVAADYDGDGKTDIAIFRPLNGDWFLRSSINGATTLIPNFGPQSGDVPVPADYDGDGKADIAIFRPLAGNWFIRNSSTGGTTFVSNYGPQSGDMPVPRDYDGDGKADIAIFRPLAGNWYVLQSTNGSTMLVTNYGPQSGDVPVPGDYDGDGKADIAIFRPIAGNWFIRNSSTLQTAFVPNFGPQVNDKAVPKFAYGN